jgi:hypothetical protein
LHGDVIFFGACVVRAIFRDRRTKMNQKTESTEMTNPLIAEAKKRAAAASRKHESQAGDQADREKQARDAAAVAAEAGESASGGKSPLIADAEKRAAAARAPAGK